MVVGTWSLVQKGQTSGRSGCSGHSGMQLYMVVGTVCLWWNKDQTSGCSHIVSGAQWMQYAVDAVHSGIVVYGGGDIVLWCKKVKPVDSVDAVTQWTQYTVDAVCSMQWNSGIWWWGNCLWCKKVKPVDAVDAIHSRCSTNNGICSGGDIVFDTKRSNQWTQWMQYIVHSGCSQIVVIWWWAHCLWCKKVKPVDAVDAVHSRCSRIVVYGGGDIVFDTKRSNQWTQWMQYAVHAVHSGCSGILVNGGGDIVFGAKGSNQQMHWMQYAVDAVCSGHSGIVVYGGGHIVFGAKRSNQWMHWMQYAVDAVHSRCSGIVVYGGGHIVFGAKRSNQWMHWMQYAVDAVCSGHSGIVVYGGGHIVCVVQKGANQWFDIGCSTQ